MAFLKSKVYMYFSLSQSAGETQLKRSFYLLFGLLTASLYIRLGDQPLYLEEPRRALVALEMLFRNNLIVPTEFGDLYYNKPPLWNWVIILSYKIFGYNEFAVRFFSVLSFIITGLIIYLTGKKYVTLRFGILSSLFFLISVDIYFYFSATGEIDLFYALLSFGGFISLFHFYQKKQYYTLFLLTYFLGALGTLTKGVPSLAFLGLSILVFFIYNKDFKRLFTLPHFSGIFLYLIVVGGYVLAYSRYEDPSGFISTLWSEASNRTAVSKGLMDVITHFLVFPFDFLKNVIPATFFIVFVFKKNLFKQIKQNKYIEFSWYILIFNILIYWLSPGTRPRYVYMLFPLIINILIYFYCLYANEQKRLNQILEVIFGCSIALFALAFVSLFILPEARVIPYATTIAVISILLFSSLCVLYFKFKEQRIFIFILATILLRIAFNFTVLEHRSIAGDIQKEKELALKLAEMTKGEKLYTYRSSDLTRTMTFYLEREKLNIVSKAKHKNLEDYFIVKETDLQHEKYSCYYRYEFRNENYCLLKFH